MIGLYVSPAVALRHLKQMREEILDGVRRQAAKGFNPEETGGFGVWVDKHEERLAVLDVMEAHLKALPANSVLAKPGAKP